MRLLQSLLVVLSCASLAAYFGHHLVSGKYGLKTQARLSDRLALVERQVAGLEAVEIRLRRDINLLIAQPPDRDMVEDIAISTLGFAYPRDTIVLQQTR